MATTTVSKIQIRRGLQSDLPGAPTIASPTVPTPGLDIGEPALATDTNRLFIGIDPSQGGITIGRTVFPYQNVEILTENSPVVTNFFVENSKNLSTPYFTSMPLLNTDIVSISTNALLHVNVISSSYVVAIPFSDTSGVVVGSLAVGRGIPANAFVFAVSPTSVTLLIDRISFATDPTNVGGFINVNAATVVRFVNDAWNTLTLNTGETFYLAGTNGMACARIVYFLFDSQTPIRSGVMSVMAKGGSIEPILQDEGCGYPRADLSIITIDETPDAVFGSLEFRAANVLAYGAQAIVIQYRNATGYQPVMYFRTEQPSFPTGT